MSVIIKNAAVADYAPEKYSRQKIKKTGNSLTLNLVKGKDILYDLGNKEREYILIGFAAESENIIDNAMRKIKKKKMDYIIVNDIANSDIGFRSDSNEGFLINKDGTMTKLNKGSKKEMANDIFDNIFCNNI